MHLLPVLPLVSLASWTFGTVFAHSSDQLLVETTSGTLRGIYNATGVRAFLGVPYAFPPIGPHRFAAPVPFVADHGTVHNATSFGYTCPGQYYEPPSIYTLLPYMPFTSQHEDCLSLNVWAPSKERLKAKGNKLPVMVFIHGGYFTQGGSATESTDATHLVQNNDIIVVTMNYRLSVLGFPNFGDTRNAGILDQRLALEWARDNAERFGGDPKRIVLFGQSAGGISSDAHTFAVFNSTSGYDASIASGVGILSGGVFLGHFFFSPDTQQLHFGQLARAVGCDSTDPDALMSCMRQVPAEALMYEIVTNGNAHRWRFGPAPDERLIYSNYTQRFLGGDTTRVPMYISTLENECTGLVPFSPQGINTTQAEDMIYPSFVCPAWQGAGLRARMNTTVYRVRYAGNYTNISPYPWPGTYHSADLPMYFGSAIPTFGGRNATEDQRKAVALLQSYLVAFANDPKHGLSKLGLPPYSPLNESMVVVDASNTTGLARLNAPGVVLDSNQRYDAPCFI